MKNSKLKLVSNNAITLIALIVTIIILLILAGVTIAMLTGENGILNKAINAKERTLEAQYEEELNMCILEMQTDELGTLTMEKIIKKLPQYIQNSQPQAQYEWDIEQTAEEPEGIYKGYNFKIDKNKKAHITEKATGIMISCSVSPSGYTNQNVTATIKITCNEGIKTIQLEGEEVIQVNQTEWTTTKENIEVNAIFKYKVLDSKGNTETKIVQVVNIDKLPPKTAQIEVENIAEGLKIKVTAEDEEQTEENAYSGIGKYEYYIDGELKETKDENTCIIKDLEINKEYSVYVKVYDKAGNKKETETIKIIRKIPLKVNDISAAESSSSAIDEQGKVWAWGNNYKGKLGVGTDTNVLLPQFIKTETKFKEINLGENVSMAKDEENNLWAWGYNNRYQLGDGTNEDKIMPTRTSYGINFSKISIGNNSNIAIDEEGNLWTWGYNNNYQLGDGTTQAKSIPTKVQSVNTVKFKEISAGSSNFNIAIDEEGNLWGVGSNLFGQLGNGKNTSVTKFIKISTQAKFQKISAGGTHTLAIDKEGNLWTCGDNSEGQLGDGTNDARNTMKQITSGIQFKEIYAGFAYNIAIDEQGNTWAWGNNNNGQLGDGTNEDKINPTKITYEVKFKKFAVGYHHTLAIDEENNLWAWGYNNNGQLGDGTIVNSNKPKKIF